MVLLARTADRLYWGARYVERAEDTARIVRAYHDLVVDAPGDVLLSWEPLCALAGSTPDPDLVGPDDPTGEETVLHFIIADRSNPGSVASSVAMARENLRTTREVMPREAWQAVNSLSQYVDAASAGAVHRQLRDRFLARVVDDSRRLDGVVESTMTRTSPYELFRVGRLVERSDMTTRVLGIRAAELLQAKISHVEEFSDEVQWMGVLRSLSALQMYQRATRGPIEGTAVVRFLLFYSAFPRSVQGCFDGLRDVLVGLPSPEPVVAALDEAEGVLAGSRPIVSDGVALDAAMDRVQLAIAAIDRAVRARYVSVAG